MCPPIDQGGLDDFEHQPEISLEAMPVPRFFLGRHTKAQTRFQGRLTNRCRSFPRSRLDIGTCLSGWLTKLHSSRVVFLRGPNIKVARRRRPASIGRRLDKHGQRHMMKPFCDMEKWLGG